MLLLYNLLSVLILCFYLPRMLLKKGPVDRFSYIRERLGLSTYDKTDIWIHAVSVGETIAALSLLKRIVSEFPQKKIVLSTTTYTGQKIARARFKEAQRVMYMPWDSAITVNRVIKSLNPDLFITMETEIWPNVYHRLKKGGSRIILLNGRLSEESYRGYRLIRFFMKRVLSSADFFLMQSRGDASRILRIGAEESKIGVMGNMKFDLEAGDMAHLPWLDSITGPIFVAGSTHRGEEDIVLDAYKRITAVMPGVTLILAPRHPERFSEVAELMSKRSLRFINRTLLEQQPEPCHAGKISATSKEGKRHPIILLDTIGELSQVFSRAAISFVGGSLLPYGGHNIFEPAYWGKPVICGPHMDNFPIANEFFNKSAAVMVKNSHEMSEAAAQLLKNPARAKTMGENAKKILRLHAGATDKAVALIRRLLGTT